MDSKKYTELKSAGLVTITNGGVNFTLNVKQFDVSTGQPIDDQVISMNTDDLTAQNVNLQAQIDSNNTLIADAQSAPIQNMPPIKDNTNATP